MIRKFIRIGLIVFLIGFITSCASTSKASETTSNDAKSFDVKSDKGIVYLYRTGRALGAGVQLNVKVNSTDAGGTGPSTFFRWELKPGIYTFSSSTNESSAVSQLDVKVGKVYFLRQDARLGINGSRVTMKEMDSNKGEKEVKECKMLISSYIPK